MTLFGFRLPDDPEDYPGWWIFKPKYLYRLFGFKDDPYKEEGIWHDQATKDGSPQEKLGIPVTRIDQNFRDQMREGDKSPHQEWKRYPKLRRWIRHRYGSITKRLTKYFYGGPR